MAGQISGSKQGILTIAVMLLGSVLLALVLSISAYAAALSSTNRELAKIEQAAVQIDSASFGIQSILAHEGVNVTYHRGNSSTNVSFLINARGMRNYPLDAERFAGFVSSQPGSNMSISAAGVKWPRFRLRPSDIAADFGTAGWATFSPNAAPYSAGSITGYDVIARLEQPTPALAWINLSEAPQEGQDALYLHIGVQGTSGGVVSYSGYLNRSGASEARLLDESGQAVVAIYAEPPSALKIYYDAGNGTELTGLNGTIEAVVMLNSSATAELGTSIINVNGAVTNSGPVIMDEN